MIRNTLSAGERAGKKLKNLIKESKFKTQERFAEEMSVDPTTVRRWIAYGVNQLDTIEELAEHLDVDFMEFLKCYEPKKLD